MSDLREWRGIILAAGVDSDAEGLAGERKEWVSSYLFESHGNVPSVPGFPGFP